MRRSSSRWAPSAPNTARRIAFSVIRIIGSRVSNCVPSGQFAVSRSVSSSTIFSKFLMLLPWKGGVSNLRRLRWSAPSSAKTEPAPSIRLRLGWMLPTSSVLAVNSCLASCGSATITVWPNTGMFIVNTLP